MYRQDNRLVLLKLIEMYNSYLNILTHNSNHILPNRCILSSASFCNRLLPPPPPVDGGYSGLSEFYLDYKGIAFSYFIGLIEKPGAT